MQRRKWGQWANVVLAVFLAIPLSGCDSAVSEAVQSRVSDEELLPRVAAMIDAELPVIRDYVGDELDSERSLESVTGAEVVEQTLQEQNGRAYIEFSYGVQASESEEDGEELLRQSRQLLSDEAYQELEGRIAEKRMALMAEGESVAKDLAPSMQKAFYKDLQTVVVKSVVLLTAGAVYACIPHAVWWGKIAAAAAVAVAAGVVAASIMSLYRYYRFGGTKGQAFNEWLSSVTTEPKSAYLVASSMISIGSTLKRSPVLTGIIICVFGIYGIVDDVKPLLAKYYKQ